MNGSFLINEPGFKDVPIYVRCEASSGVVWFKFSLHVYALTLNLRKKIQFGNKRHITALIVVRP